MAEHWPGGFFNNGVLLIEQTYSWRQKAATLLSILYPIFITQLAYCAINFFDTTMSGHASPDDLAGVAIGSNLWMPVFTAVGGVLLAVTPIMAQLHGAKRSAEVPAVVAQGIYLALLLAAATIGLGAVTVTALLGQLNLEPAVFSIAQRFLGAIALGVAPFFVNMVLRNFIDALGYTRVTMLIALCALPINICLNYMLVFGKFGFPRLGGVGSGYASALTYWCITIMSVLVVQKVAPFRDYRLLTNWSRPSWPALKEQLVIGLPIGIAIFCETSIFGVVALFMSHFGTLTIAAHQAAINFVSLIYMLPLSISMALTIVVGFETGARRLGDARQYGFLGIGTAVCLALISAGVLVLYNEPVAALYSDDSAVKLLIQSFLVYAAFFQLSDAVAAPIQGILRGYKDVTVTFVMALVSYWVIGLPVGYWLAGDSSYGAYGYWIGFIVGLAAGAVGLAVRLSYVQRRTSRLTEE